MRILYLEPFNAGSHAAFTGALTRGIDAKWTVHTLPGRHWKWRMRGSAAWFADAMTAAPVNDPPQFDLLFASSFLPLAEFIGLRPELARVPRVLYFHENQLAYPVRDEFTGERDSHYGFSQMVSALAADRCVFNSAYNRDSFIEGARALLAGMPDAVPKGWTEAMARKSEVLPVPMTLPSLPADAFNDTGDRAAGPILFWNHRWEHDKNPEAFFHALFSLQGRGVPFRLAVCGERYGESPRVFDEARRNLADRIVHWGYVESRGDYERLLGLAQIAVSTANHEFFGVSILEAVHFGARPLVPDRLAYPGHFPAEYRYSTDDDLIDSLESLCRRWTAGEMNLRADRTSITAPYRKEIVLRAYESLFHRAVERAGRRG